MAFDNPIYVQSETAAADLSTHQFKVVKYDGAGAIVLAGLGENSCGLLQNDPALGGVGDVMKLGVSRGIASAAIAKGAKVAAAADGKLVTAATTHHVVGIAEEAAAADGDIVAVLVCLGGAPLP